jgi:hypothetical protein
LLFGSLSGFDRRLIVPVVDDSPQQVGIRTMWHGLGEVTCHLFDTTGCAVPVVMAGISSSVSSTIVEYVGAVPSVGLLICTASET